VAVVHSDGPASEEPQLEATDEEDEAGEPEREEKEELEEVVTDKMVPKPVSDQSPGLYAARRGVSRHRSD
jgi:hypothetical protein